MYGLYEVTCTRVRLQISMVAFFRFQACAVRAEADQTQSNSNLTLILTPLRYQLEVP